MTNPDPPLSLCTADRQLTIYADVDRWPPACRRTWLSERRRHWNLPGTAVLDAVHLASACRRYGTVVNDRPPGGQYCSTGIDDKMILAAAMAFRYRHHSIVRGTRTTPAAVAIASMSRAVVVTSCQHAAKSQSRCHPAGQRISVPYQRREPLPVAGIMSATQTMVVPRPEDLCPPAKSATRMLAIRNTTDGWNGIGEAVLGDL